MEGVIQSVLTGVPVLLLHAAITFAILIVGTVLYLLVTPWEDLRLVRGGNVAAGIAMGGLILGLAIPLAANLRSSVTYWDILIWGAVTIAIQMVTYKVVDLLLSGLPKRIEAGEVAAATLLTFTKLAVAIILAAAVAG